MITSVDMVIRQVTGALSIVTLTPPQGRMDMIISKYPFSRLNG